MPFSAGFLGGVPAVMLGTVLVGGAALYSAGTVRVAVHEKKPGGTNISLALPAAAVPLALKFVPDRRLQNLPPEMRAFLPAIQIAGRELAGYPDVTLVQVENPHEKVSIVKRGGSLVIDVDSRRETVHVSFPLRIVAAVARDLETSAPAN